MEPAHDLVTMEEFRLHQKDAEHKEDRRNGFERRTNERMDKLELEQRRQTELMTGKDGRNGMMSRLSLTEHIIAWHSKVLWGLGGSLATAVVGAAAKLYGA